MATHRELYPDQYAHPLVGKRVAIEDDIDGIKGTVERVVQSRFGAMVILVEYGANHAWAVGDAIVQDRAQYDCPECGGTWCRRDGSFEPEKCDTCGQENVKPVTWKEPVR